MRQIETLLFVCLQKTCFFYNRKDIGLMPRIQRGERTVIGGAKENPRSESGKKCGRKKLVEPRGICMIGKLILSYLFISLSLFIIHMRV